MDFANYSIRKLDIGEYIQKFDCGDDDLNDFILNEAPLYRKSLLAVTYAIVSNTDPHQVLAFCSLANDRISLSDFDEKSEFNRFRKHQQFPQSKRMKSYPAVKICRLGVDSTMKGQSVGRSFLDFIKYYFIADNKTGCRFLTVDAYIDAIPFYEKNGFKPLNSDDEDSTYTRLLFFDLNELI